MKQCEKCGGYGDSMVPCVCAEVKKDIDRKLTELEERLVQTTQAAWGFVYARTRGPAEALHVAMALVGALLERCEIDEVMARAMFEAQLALVERKPNGGG